MGSRNQAATAAVIKLSADKSRQLLSQLKTYRATRWRSITQLLGTAGGYIALWLCMWLALDHGYWITLLLTLPAAGLLVRLFIIQHDCGHEAYFKSRCATLRECM